MSMYGPERCDSKVEGRYNGMAMEIVVLYQRGAYPNVSQAITDLMSLSRKSLPKERCGTQTYNAIQGYIEGVIQTLQTLETLALMALDEEAC